MRSSRFLPLALLLAAACAAGPDANGVPESPSAPSISPSPSPSSSLPSSSPAPAADSPAPPPPPPNPAVAPWRKQVLYLLLLDRFRNGSTANDTLGTGGAACLATNDPQRYHGGDLEGLRQNLGYLKELGATAIWTTPLYEQITEMLPSGRCGYHGYWANFGVPPNDVTAIEPKLGTEGELTQLVTDLHAKEMRLVMDMVVNHTGDTASLPKTHPDWFHDPATCHALGNPTVTCPLDKHPDFAEEKPVVAAYLTDVAKQWTQKYGIDAIRMDTAKHVSASYFEQSFLPGVKSVAKVPHLFTIAEVFDEGSLTQAKTYLDAGFDSTFHFPLRRAFVEAIAKNGSTDAIANAVADGIAKVGASRALDLVLFIDNHDVPRFANEPGFGVDEADIQQRLLLALDLMFTLPGIPQLYYGDELGMYGGKDPDNRRDLPDWAMTTAGRSVAHQGSVAAVPSKTFDRVKKLTTMRRSIDALSDGKYRELWRQNGSAQPNVFAFARGEGAGARVVVINNAATSTGRLSIPIASAIFAPNTGLSDELGDGAPTTTTLDGNGQLVIDLPPRTAGIYRAGP